MAFEQFVLAGDTGGQTGLFFIDLQGQECANTFWTPLDVFCWVQVYLNDAFRNGLARNEQATPSGATPPQGFVGDKLNKSSITRLCCVCFLFAGTRVRSVSKGS